MSTFKEIIDLVDESKPNAFTNAKKFRWLADLNGRIGTDVFLLGIEEIRALPHKYPEDADCETLVGYPHDGLYEYYLEAQIDAANGEYDHYQNSMELYNESYNNFVRWFCSVYRPAQGGGVEMCPDVPAYYITAYGLAVKQGYQGSVDQWLQSLKGEKGDTGKSAYEYAREAGYTGDEETFRECQLNYGKTAYEYAVEGGFQGTSEDFRKKMAAPWAEEDHNHDGSYAPKNHDHNDSYASKNHDHNGSYAPKNHDHDGNYLKVAQGAVAEAMILKRGLHYGTEGERPVDAAEGQVYMKLTKMPGGSVAADVKGQASGGTSIGGYSTSNADYAGYNGSAYYGYVLKFAVGALPGTSVGVDVKLRMYQGIGTNATMRYALCTSDANKANYVGVSGAVEDVHQIAAGTVTFENLTKDRAVSSIIIDTDRIASNTEYYLFLWADGQTGITVEAVTNGWGDHAVAVRVNGERYTMTMELRCDGYWVTAAQEV